MQELISSPCEFGPIFDFRADSSLPFMLVILLLLLLLLYIQIQTLRLREP